MELYKPEGYEERIKALESGNSSLYIGEIGVYNKKLDEGDFRNYLTEIFIGVAVVVTVVVVIATAGAAVPAIMGAIGLGGLSSGTVGAVVAAGVVGAAYGGIIGLGIGAKTGAVGHFVNTTFGEGNYAMDGTYLTEDSRSNLFNQYVGGCAKAAGAAAGWIVETAWDGVDLIKAVVTGDKIGMAAGVFSLLMSGDDIIKGFKNLGNGADGATNAIKNIDNLADTTKRADDIVPEGKSFADLMDPKEAERYNEYWENKSFADLMDPQEAKRYNQYWDDLNDIDDVEEVVTVRRVQGGDGTYSQNRISINEDGSINITNHGSNLSVSIDDGEHSKYFLTKRPGAEVVEFEIPKWMDDFIKENEIPSKGYRTNPLNQGGSAPKVVDPSVPGISYELPDPWVEWLEEYGRNAKVISN